MKKYEKIYLDMDGVIADFDTHFENLFGLSPVGYEATYGTIVFWDKILEHRDFFAEIPAFEHIDDLISICKTMTDNLVILSSPARFNTPLCMLQKRHWLDYHGYKDLPAIFEKDKYLFGRPGVLLIDDFKKNIEKFANNDGDTHHFKSYEGFLQFYNDWKLND